MVLGAAGSMQAHAGQRVDLPPAVAPGSTPLRVGGDIKEPEKIRDVDPIYPAGAQAAGIQGAVILEATIGPDGRVTNTNVLQGHPALTQAALDAVRQWEYKPTIFGGVPVSVLTTVVVSFRLASRGGLESFGRPGYGLPVAPLHDLTGEWRGDDGGTYQMRSVGDELFWSGADAHEKRASVFHGSLTSPNEYSGRWADVPPGTGRGSGAISIRVVGPDEIVVVGSPPEFSGRRWERVRQDAPGTSAPDRR